MTRHLRFELGLAQWGDHLQRASEVLFLEVFVLTDVGCYHAADLTTIVTDMIT